MGYETLVFLDDDQIDENLKCAICFGVCEEATTACFSGHTFCAKCLQLADRGASTGKCPTCRADKIHAPNRPLRGMIDALPRVVVMMMRRSRRRVVPKNLMVEEIKRLLMRIIQALAVFGKEN